MLNSSWFITLSILNLFYAEGTTNKQRKGFKMKMREYKKQNKINEYNERLLNNDLTIKELKNDTYFTFKSIEDPDAKQVWIKEKNSYCRDIKKYIVSNFEDYNKEKLIDGSKKVFTSFTF